MGIPLDDLLSAFRRKGFGDPESYQFFDFACAYARETALYSTLSSGNSHYLLAHDSFAKDLPDAIDRLEKMMENI